MNYFSFHTHSSYCDGKASVWEMCRAAVEAGLSAIGFAGHAPLPFKTGWAMQLEDVLSYRNDIEQCKSEFGSKIKVYAALEADYLPLQRFIGYDTWRNMLNLDYIIGSVHLVLNPEKAGQLWFLDGPEENYEKGLNACFDGDIRKGVSQYYKQIQEMVVTQKPDVIAHIDKVVMNNKNRFFTEDEEWCQTLVEDTLQVIRENNVVVEVNTRGIYKGKYHTFFPNEQIISRCVELDIPLTVSVDAHGTNELTSGFRQGVEAVKRLGAKGVVGFNEGYWRLM